MPKAKGGFYAVKKGRAPGIYHTWDECHEQVTGYPGAAYKKFADLPSAQEWVGGTKKTTAEYSTTAPAGGGASTSAATSKMGKTKVTVAESVEVKLPSSGAQGEWDVVYTDGACRGNGQAGSVAGVGVWWGASDDRNLSERCPGVQTNNRAELIAIIRVLETTPQSKTPLLIKSDSQYSIKCIDEWLPNWQRRGWRTATGSAVKNVSLIRYLAALLAARAAAGQRVRLQHVRGHAGEVGNEGADVLAVGGTALPEQEELDWDAAREAVEKRAPGAVEEIEVVEEEEVEVVEEHKVKVAVEEKVYSVKVPRQPEEKKVYLVDPADVDVSTVPGDEQVFADMVLSDDQLEEMARTGNFDRY